VERCSKYSQLKKIKFGNSYNERLASLDKKLKGNEELYEITETGFIKATEGLGKKPHITLTKL
jgi:hypothetical protein